MALRRGDGARAVESLATGINAGIALGTAIEAHRARVKDREDREAAAELQKGWMEQAGALETATADKRKAIEGAVEGINARWEKPGYQKTPDEEAQMANLQKQLIGLDSEYTHNQMNFLRKMSLEAGSNQYALESVKNYYGLMEQQLNFSLGLQRDAANQRAIDSRQKENDIRDQASRREEADTLFERQKELGEQGHEYNLDEIEAQGAETRKTQAQRAGLGGYKTKGGLTDAQTAELDSEVDETLTGMREQFNYEGLEGKELAAAKGQEITFLLGELRKRGLLEDGEEKTIKGAISRDAKKRDSFIEQAYEEIGAGIFNEKIEVATSGKRTTGGIDLGPAPEEPQLSPEQTELSARRDKVSGFIEAYNKVDEAITKAKGPSRERLIQQRNKLEQALREAGASQSFYSGKWNTDDLDEQMESQFGGENADNLSNEIDDMLGR